MDRASVRASIPLPYQVPCQVLTWYRYPYVPVPLFSNGHICTEQVRVCIGNSFIWYFYIHRRNISFAVYIIKDRTRYTKKYRICKHIMTCSLQDRKKVKQFLNGRQVKAIPAPYQVVYSTLRVFPVSPCQRRGFPPRSFHESCYDAFFKVARTQAVGTEITPSMCIGYGYRSHSDCDFFPVTLALYTPRSFHE